MGHARWFAMTTSAHDAQQQRWPHGTKACVSGASMQTLHVATDATCASGRACDDGCEADAAATGASSCRECVSCARMSCARASAMSSVFSEMPSRETPRATRKSLSLRMLHRSTPSYSSS